MHLNPLALVLKSSALISFLRYKLGLPSQGVSMKADTWHWTLHCSASELLGIGLGMADPHTLEICVT